MQVFIGSPPTWVATPGQSWIQHADNMCARLFKKSFSQKFTKRLIIVVSCCSLEFVSLDCSVRVVNRKFLATQTRFRSEDRPELPSARRDVSGRACVRVCKFMQATECSQAYPTKTPPPLISSPIWNTLIHRELSLSSSLSSPLSLISHLSLPPSPSPSPPPAPCVFGSYSQVLAESPNMWRALASPLMPLLQHWGRWLIIRSPNRMVSPETVKLELWLFPVVAVYFGMRASVPLLNSVS